MKGLIRNNFYSMESNIKLSFFIALAFAVTSVFISNTTYISVVLSIQIFVFIANTGTSLHADEIAKWNKYELTLPVKRDTIIGAKYISFGILICLGLLMSGLTLACVMFLKIPIHSSSVIWGYGYGLTLSIIMTAFMYPIMLKIGTEKNELVLLLSAAIAVGVMLLIAFALSGVTGGMNLRHPLVGTVSIAVSLVLFLVSFFLSLNIHKNKEF